MPLGVMRLTPFAVLTPHIAIPEIPGQYKQELMDKLRHLLTSPRSERDEVIAKRKIIGEAQAKTIATALGGGADTFKQWGLSPPASDF